MLAAIALTRTFGSRVAVENVSFELKPGEVFALLGPNGAGKTTTLRMLAGLIAPTAGSVRLDGEVMSPATAPALRGRIGLLTETPGLWERLTVRLNLLTYARLHGISDPEAAVDRLLRQFGIADRAHEQAGGLSKGLKQRAALARTLLHDPGVVLLDEPTAGLDPQSARDVRELVVALRREGRAVLLCTHNLDEAERLADRVGVLRTQLIAVDTPDALRSRLFAPRVRVRLAGPAAPFASLLRLDRVHDVNVDGCELSAAVADLAATPAIVRRLVAAGADLLAVVPEEPTLEDVYLRLLEEKRS